MLIDCDRCAARGRECADCVVTVLLGAPPDHVAAPVPGAIGSPAAGDADCESFGAVVELDDEQRRALEVLAAGGLVPRLRMVPIRDPGRRAG